MEKKIPRSKCFNFHLVLFISLTQLIRFPQRNNLSKLGTNNIVTHYILSMLWFLKLNIFKLNNLIGRSSVKIRFLPKEPEHETLFTNRQLLNIPLLIVRHFTLFFFSVVGNPDTVSHLFLFYLLLFFGAKEFWHLIAHMYKIWPFIFISIPQLYYK